jgi:phage shock protein A
MLAKLYKEHQEKQTVLKMQNDGRRREVLHAVPRVTDALVTSVNQNVSEIFGNQRYIEREVRSLQEQSTRFTKQTQQWLTCIDSFNNHMKDLGDFEGYAANIEGDMRTIATAIQMITQRSRQPPPKPPGAAGSPGVGSPGGGSPRLLV